MIRSASLLVVTGALWAGAAHAQMSSADLVTRIDRLQAQVRELTGTVEELQYRNQQLEQEVQRLRAGSPAAGATPPTTQSSGASWWISGAGAAVHGSSRVGSGSGVTIAATAFERSGFTGLASRRCVRSGSRSGCARRAAAARLQHRCQRAAAHSSHRRDAAHGGRTARPFEPIPAAAGNRHRSSWRRSAAAGQSRRHRRDASRAAAR
jgi:hypothetical protein